MYNWDLSNQRVFKEQIEERKKKGDFKWRLQTRGRQKHSRRVVIGASASSRDFRSYTNNVKGNLSYAEARVLRIDADRDRRLLDKAQRDRLFHRNLRRKQREQQLKRKKEIANAKRKREMALAARGLGNRKEKKALHPKTENSDHENAEVDSEMNCESVKNAPAISCDASETSECSDGLQYSQTEKSIEKPDPKIVLCPIVEPIRKNTSFVYAFSRPHTTLPNRRFRPSELLSCVGPPFFAE